MCKKTFQNSDELPVFLLYYETGCEWIEDRAGSVENEQ